MDHEELEQAGFVSQESGVNRIWINAPDAVYFVDFGASPAITEGLENGDPSYWAAVVEYAEQKIELYEEALSKDRTQA